MRDEQKSETASETYPKEKIKPAPIIKPPENTKSGSELEQTREMDIKVINAFFGAK